MSETNKKTDGITLDAVENAFSEWRANRDNGGARSISDTLWRQVFQLERQGHEGERLRRIFGLNSGQYQKKRQQLIAEAPSTQAAHCPTIDNPPRFSELTVKTPGELSPTQQTLRNIKHTKLGSEAYLDNQTMIIECNRSDGHRLLMHISTSQVDQIFDAFFKQEGHHA